jgi:hypothetical protein
MNDARLSSEEAAEELRKRYRYRQLILSGKLALPYKRAAQLLGPDCMYQLYSLRESETKKPGRKKNPRTKSSR